MAWLTHGLLLAIFSFASSGIGHADVRSVPIENGVIRLKDIGLGTDDRIEILLERKGLDAISTIVSGVRVQKAEVHQKLKLCSHCEENSTILVLIGFPKTDSDTFDLKRKPINTMVVVDGSGIYVLPLNNPTLGRQYPNSVTPILTVVDQKIIDLIWHEGKLYREAPSSADTDPYSDGDGSQDFAEYSENRSTGGALRQDESATSEELPPGGVWSQHGDWVVSMSPFPPYDCNASTAAYFGGGQVGLIVRLDRRENIPWVFLGSDTWSDFRAGSYKVDYVIDGSPALEGNMDFVPRITDFVDRLGGFSVRLDDDSFSRFAKALSSGSRTFRIRTYDVSPQKRVFVSNDISLKGSTAALNEVGACQQAEGLMLRRQIGVDSFADFLGWD